jgi:hypothetical protein
VNNLEKSHLKRLCDKYGVDYYEIDNTLTYDENKKHIMEMVKMLRHSLDNFDLAQIEAMQEQYMKEHFLSYFIMCQLNNETTPAEMGKVLEPPRKFSLAEFAEQQAG